MAVAINMPPIWPVTPDWTNGIGETLEWATGLLQSDATALTRHSALRLCPRRSFSFRIVSGAQERRIAAMLVAGHSGTWLLPIWPDVQCLTGSVAPGDLLIPCSTAGRDFVAGGKALIYQDVATWQVVDVDVVASDHLQLAAGAAAAPMGARLYPLRRARLAGDAQETLLSDDVSNRTLTFDISESCDWPVLSPAGLYQGHPVLDVRPDESTDPENTVERLLQSVDYGTAPPFVHDLARVGMRTQQSHWKLFGRAEHTWFRSLLYTLAGRSMPMWVPSWATDLLAVGTIAGGSKQLTVEWAGYTIYGLGRPNRTDLRIELHDGTVLYRGITDATTAGNTEVLVLDQPLTSTALPASEIRVISFLALCVGASDKVDIEHVTDADGVATATLGWQAVVPDAA